MKCDHPHWFYHNNDLERNCQDCNYTEVKATIWIQVPEGSKIEWSK